MQRSLFPAVRRVEDFVRATGSAEIGIAFSIQPPAIAFIVESTRFALLSAPTALETPAACFRASTGLLTGDTVDIAIAIRGLVAAASMIAREERLSLVLHPGVVGRWILQPIVVVPSGRHLVLRRFCFVVQPHRIAGADWGCFEEFEKDLYFCKFHSPSVI